MSALVKSKDLAPPAMHTTYNPYVIYCEVLRSLSAVSVHDDDNVLVVGTHNAAYGNEEKANKFLPVYREFVSRHHLLAWQEIDQQFLELVAGSAEHYTAYCTSPNSRGQAIGFTIHRRLQVINTEIYSQVQDINSIVDLRPALRLDLRDLTTGLRITAMVVHYKSSHGGVRATSPVRRQQAKAQADAMQIQDEFALCVGDYNQQLEISDDIDPLIRDGFSVFPRCDRASTHVSGGRVDGLLIKNVPANVKITGYKVRNFWRNSKIGCSLSDHGLLSWKIVVR
jgi:pSer/pThr/pTyr-binding forkhead associated (FHA) protein